MILDPGAVWAQPALKDVPTSGIQREHRGTNDDEVCVPKALRVLENRPKNNQRRFSVAPMMEEADSAIFSDIYEGRVTQGSH